MDSINAHLNTSLTSLSDPFMMKGMGQAVDRLVRAVGKREKIGIFGDYDADGVTSAALLCLFMKEIGIETSVYIPHRERDGYGLNNEGLDVLLSKGCSLVITVDCGIAGIEESRYAGQIGLDLIITDHHEPQEGLPGCLALINPKQPGCDFPFKRTGKITPEKGPEELKRLFEVTCFRGTPGILKSLLWIRGTTAPLNGDRTEK